MTSDLLITTTDLLSFLAALAGFGLLALLAFLFPEVLRLRRLERERDELRRARDRLAAGNEKRAAMVLRAWRPRERGLWRW